MDSRLNVARWLTATALAAGLAVFVAAPAAAAAPVALDDGYAVADGQTLFDGPGNGNGGVLYNDSDADGDALTAVLVGGPSHGLLTLAPNGTVTYTPDAGYTGTDAFTYQAFDGATLSNVATVFLDVLGNDPPAAYDDAFVTDQDVPLSVDAAAVFANDVDPDGDPLVYDYLGAPAHGTRSLQCGACPFVYTPEPGFSGVDTLLYAANDGFSVSNQATITITVNPTSPVNQAPVAVDDNYSVAQDEQLSLPAPGVLANDSDPDGDALILGGFNDFPSHGDIGDAAGFILYTPAPGFAGSDSFTYWASDGTADSNLATVTIEVAAAPDNGDGDGGGGAEEPGDDGTPVPSDDVDSPPADDGDDAPSDVPSPGDDGDATGDDDPQDDGADSDDSGTSDLVVTKLPDTGSGKGQNSNNGLLAAMLALTVSVLSAAGLRRARR